MGAKLSPLLNKDVSSCVRMWDEKLNSLTVFAVWHLCLDFLLPPLHPGLCVFFLICVLDRGWSLKKGSEDELDGFLLLSISPIDIVMLVEGNELWGLWWSLLVVVCTVISLRGDKRGDMLWRGCDETICCGVGIAVTCFLLLELLCLVGTGLFLFLILHLAVVEWLAVCEVWLVVVGLLELCVLVAVFAGTEVQLLWLGGGGLAGPLWGPLSVGRMDGRWILWGGRVEVSDYWVSIRRFYYSDNHLGHVWISLIWSGLKKSSFFLVFLSI